MRNSRTIFLVAVPLLGALATSGEAREWEWSYNPGTRWPEELGWIHAFRGADRKLGGGQIHFDSREPYGLWDGYKVEFPKRDLSPGPGETYIARARVKVDYVDTFYGDAGVFVAGNVGSVVYGGSIIFGVDRVWSTQGKYAEIEPYVFHDYEVRSRTMRDYELYVDGSLALRDTFLKGTGIPLIAWGDETTRRGVSHFDYVSFRVVSDYAAAHEQAVAPEAQSSLALALLVAVWPRARSGAPKSSR